MKYVNQQEAKSTAFSLKYCCIPFLLPSCSFQLRACWVAHLKLLARPWMHVIFDFCRQCRALKFCCCFFFLKLPFVSCPIKPMSHRKLNYPPPPFSVDLFVIVVQFPSNIPSVLHHVNQKSTALPFKIPPTIFLMIYCCFLNNSLWLAGRAS